MLGVWFKTKYKLKSKLGSCDHWHKVEITWPWNYIYGFQEVGLNFKLLSFLVILLDLE